MNFQKNVGGTVTVTSEKDICVIATSASIEGKREKRKRKRRKKRTANNLKRMKENREK